jgi:hypothetical protein
MFFHDHHRAQTLAPSAILPVLVVLLTCTASKLIVWCLTWGSWVSSGSPVILADHATEDPSRSSTANAAFRDGFQDALTWAFAAEARSSRKRPIPGRAVSVGRAAQATSGWASTSSSAVAWTVTAGPAPAS